MRPEADLYQEIAARCALFNVRKAARAVTALYEDALRPSGVGANQFTLLTAIQNTEPAPMSELASALEMDRTTLTRGLQPLQQNGWAEVRPGRDRRVREVRLTPEGREALARAVPLWREAQGRVEADLGPERWGQALGCFRAVARVGPGE